MISESLASMCGREYSKADGIIEAKGSGKIGPQAYVGYEKEKSDYLGGAYDIKSHNFLLGPSVALAASCTDTLNYFYLDCMNGATLAQCIRNASDASLISCPLPVPKIKTFVVRGSDQDYPITNSYPSDIYVVGHAGPTVTGLDAGDDNQFPADKNIQ